MSRTRIKICGLIRDNDVRSAVRSGADALGFVFYPKSARAVDFDQAARLMASVPAFVTKVALFVNEDALHVAEALRLLPIDLLQFHGDESPDYCSGFGRPWIKAARIGPNFDLLEFSERYATKPKVCGILADTLVDGFGGAGKTFDWSLIPASLPLPLILSGGLTITNVARAISAVRPWAVDVSSGVEDDAGPKGIKIAAKIDEFIAGVRHADEDRAL